MRSNLHVFLYNSVVSENTRISPLKCCKYSRDNDCMWWVSWRLNYLSMCIHFFAWWVKEALNNSLCYLMLLPFLLLLLTLSSFCLPSSSSSSYCFSFFFSFSLLLLPTVPYSYPSTSSNPSSYSSIIETIITITHLFSKTENKFIVWWVREYIESKCLPFFFSFLILVVYLPGSQRHPRIKTSHLSI